MKPWRLELGKRGRARKSAKEREIGGGHGDGPIRVFSFFSLKQIIMSGLIKPHHQLIGI